VVVSWLSTLPRPPRKSILKPFTHITQRFAPWNYVSGSPFKNCSRTACALGEDQKKKEGCISRPPSNFAVQSHPVPLEQENRIRELVSLISEEHDPARISILASELARVLSSENKPWPIVLSEKPKAS
jgi:hypothetical protein